MKPAVTEFALDGVLERLLLASRYIATLFVQVAAPDAEDVSFDRVTVERQARHKGVSGTADLLVIYYSGANQTAVILVENKIDASFTPDQPKRYEHCRDVYRATNTAPVVATLLIAPECYLSGSKLARGFDGVLTYERLRPAVSGSDRDLVEMAIERAESPYEPVAVQAVMNFFKGYAVIVKSVAPDLMLKRNPNSENARPKASRTIYFDAKRSGFSGYSFLLKGNRPVSLRLSHQCWDSGAPNPSVKLMVDGWATHLSSVSSVLTTALQGSGIYVRAAGLSLAFVVDTSRLNNMRPVAGQEDMIRDALMKIQRLRSAWNNLAEPLKYCVSLSSVSNLERHLHA